MKIKYKIIVIAVIGLSGIAAVILLLILPYQKRIIADQGNIIETRKKINSQQEELQKILENNQQLKILDQGEINSMFLKKNKALEFISAIEKIAAEKNCGLTIQLSEPMEENYSELALQLSITGEWLNTLTFINELEKQSFYLNYQSVRVLPASAMLSENADMTNNITANIEAMTYWQ